MKKTAESIIHEYALYKIMAKNGKVLEVANYNPENGAAIQLWDYAGQPWQQWSFISCGSSNYRIKNHFTGKVIDLAFRTTTAGTLLHQWNQLSHKSQSWIVEHTADGVRLRNEYAGKCMDLAEMSTANGTRAQIWTDVEGGSQEWRIVRIREKTKDTENRDPIKKDAPADVIQTPSQRKHENDLVKKISGKVAGKKRKVKA